MAQKAQKYQQSGSKDPRKAMQEARSEEQARRRWMEGLNEGAEAGAHS